MPDPPPTPEGLPPDLVSALDGCTPTQLRDVAAYATQLAQYRDDEDGETERDSDDEEAVDAARDPPSSVPSKATLTTKEINGNRYHYWQWRDGEKVRSKYEGPADSA